MDALIRNLESGRVKVFVYSKKQVDKMKFTRSLISDIYRNIENFDTKIIWIYKVTPNNNHTIADVLKEYVEKYIQSKSLFFAQAGTFNMIIASNMTTDGIKIIDQEAQYLESAGFINIWWNRCMGKSYGNNDIFIYPNEGANEFIDNNLGADKIISRVFRNENDDLKASKQDQLGQSE